MRRWAGAQSLAIEMCQYLHKSTLTAPMNCLSGSPNSQRHFFAFREISLEHKMNIGCSRASVTFANLAVVALLATAVLPVSATARSISPVTGQFVNVGVAFNTQMPLVDLSEQTLMSLQQSGRKFIYSMASKECAVLKETIAKTCRLANLNISAQVRERNDNMPAQLYLNGNAQFVITLKDGEFD